MKIGFVINDFEREKAGYTTTGLALEALRRGHEVRYVPIGAFSRGLDDRLAAHVSLAPAGATQGPEAFLEAVRGARPERMPLDDLDVLMLRNDPADDHPARPWARLAGVNFARFAVEAGVLVLNDPEGLLRNLNKLNLEHYPPEVRPHSLISRDSAASSSSSIRASSPTDSSWSGSTSQARSCSRSTCSALAVWKS